MAKLYFKYGAMGSSKSAQALITKFNYEELGMTVWLIKPSVDTRDGADVVKSRIGLSATAQIITPEADIIEEYHKVGPHDVIIADEAQFFTPAQIDQLRELVDDTEIKTVCACGRKATVNARIDENGRVTTQGDQVLLGGNDRYIAMCHKCWKDRIRKQQQE